MKILVLIFSLNLILIPIKSQKYSSSWGFGAGVLVDNLNITSNSNDSLIDVEHTSKPGMNIYIVFTKPINNSFLIRTNLGFSFTNNDLNYRYTKKLDKYNNLYGSIFLPINLVIKPLKNKDYEMIFKTQLDFILMNGYNYTNRFNSSIGLGFGKEFKFNQLNLSIDLLYNLGLTNYYKYTKNFEKKLVPGVTSLKQNIFELAFCINY